MSNDNRPRVFVSQDNERDYQQADDFGDLIFLSNREIVPFSASATNLATIHGIEAGIARDYIPGHDYLLPAGGMLAIAHMFRAAFAKGGDHNVLKWDRRANKYYVYRMQDVLGQGSAQPAGERAAPVV